MKCPNCQNELHEVNFKDTVAWHCANCLGFLVEHDQLEKFHKEPSLNWLDVELWGNPEKLKVSLSSRLCPADSMPMYEVDYAGMTLDVCLVHRSIWFDRGEISKVKDIIVSRLGDETFAGFMEKAAEELGEVFTKSESSEQLKHFWIVLDLASHRIAARFPLIAQLVSQLP
ncbi:MAG: zf-TFIIB domain-containing protein [Patescibacteria group bacterium]